jgi:rhodanese-related sulfurtransferase
MKEIRGRKVVVESRLIAGGQVCATGEVVAIQAPEHLMPNNRKYIFDKTLIPLGALRKRLKELPDDKNKEMICYCKISLRGYEAALALEGNGWKNIKVMEGGIMAWPYPR